MPSNTIGLAGQSSKVSDAANRQKRVVADMSQAQTRLTRRPRRSSVRLRTAGGTKHVRLPKRPSSAVREPDQTGHPLDLLTEALAGRWKKLRQRLEKGIPKRGRAKINDAVHDVRTAARRLLATVAVLTP